MLNDSRKIISLTAQTHDETNYWTVGRNHVTKIEVEAVPGQGATVPWFGISSDNGNFCRINGAYVYAVDYGGGE